MAKGRRLEKLCADELKQEGYMTWKTVRHRFLNIDLFGLFDVVALAGDGKRLRMIQVKANRCDNKTREAIRSLRVPAGISKEVWVYKDRQGWERECL